MTRIFLETKDKKKYYAVLIREKKNSFIIDKPKKLIVKSSVDYFRVQH